MKSFRLRQWKSPKPPQSDEAVAGSCEGVARLCCYVSWVNEKLHQNPNQLMMTVVLC